MKKILFALCVLMIVPTLALASGDMVSVSELRQQVEMMGRWTKTYEAHGRTIEVDVPIRVPSAEKVPILECVPWKISEKMTDEIKKETKTEEYDGIINFESLNDKGTDTHYFGILSKERFEVYHDSPSMLLSRKPQDFLKTEKTEIPIDEINENEAYAEDNALTVLEARQVLTDILNAMYGENAEYIFDRVSIGSRGRKTKGMNDLELGEVVDYYPKGTYVLECYQTIQDIPILIEAKQIYYGVRGSDVEIKWASRINEFSYTPPHLWMQIMSPQEYAAGGCLKKCRAIREEDVPLAGLERIIGAVEEEIQGGQIRNIYSVQLGYSIFLEEDSNGIYELFPVWLIECQYSYLPENEAWYDENNDDYRNQMGYGRFVINAQTGKPFEHKSEIQNKDLICPNVITWEGV